MAIRPPTVCPALPPWSPVLPPLPCPFAVATCPLPTLSASPPALSDAAVLRSAGRIDISILTTGLSAAGRKRRQEVAAALKKIIKERGSAPTVAYTKLYQEIREQSDIVSTAVWIVLT